MIFHVFLYRLDGIILSFKSVQVTTISEDNPGNIQIPVDYVADVYVFKPIVGSVLTGIVSKKNNNHIACLVHKTFNITIPRPMRITVEDWNGSTLNIGDEVTFKIKYVDLSGELPYIKGSL
ncbi:hypothetical protein J6590_051743 [Homalodisca vitripennis]|nr:hypothetical protein J6590_051743 [Homalodisca vitripennis]